MIKGMFVRFCRNQNIENNARNIRACGIMVSNLDIQFLFKDYPFGYMARLFRLFANVIKMLHSKKILMDIIRSELFTTSRDQQED